MKSKKSKVTGNKNVGKWAFKGTDPERLRRYLGKPVYMDVWGCDGKVKLYWGILDSVPDDINGKITLTEAKSTADDLPGEKTYSIACKKIRKYNHQDPQWFPYGDKKTPY